MPLVPPPSMLPGAALESGSGSIGAPRDSWVWPTPAMPNAAMGGPHAAAYWELNGANERPSSSPSRYMMYRSEAEHAQMLAHHSQAQQAAASQFFSAPQPPLYPYGMPMHPELTQHLQRMGNTNGYALMPFPGYSMVDQAQMPMLMQMAPMGAPYPLPTDDKGHPLPALDAERPDAALDDAWERLRSEEPPARDQNMEELLALSRQAQLEAGGNANVFVCPHCEKRYVGKHARSIWRRHLQDKHAIPLSVQPRRTRWDRDANRPRNAEERRERMLESKRRWARKKREQERRMVNGGVDAEHASVTPAPSEEPEEKKRASPAPVLPTPRRPVLAERDTNARPAHPEPAKSPAEPKFVSPIPLLQSTPLRAWPVPPPRSPDGENEPKKRSAAPPSSLNKRSALDRAALASFSRVEPSPRVFPPSSSKLEARLAYSDLQGSPVAPSAKRDGRSGDQFSSPQHLNLTHSLGLAPHSASKNGSMYPSVSLTPMQGGITPYTKMPLGLTPTIGGLLRGDMLSMPPSAGNSNFWHSAGDVSASNYMMNYTALDTPSVEVARSARRRRNADASFHSSSEREEEEEEPEHDQRNASPSIRQRPRTLVSKTLAHETPSKVPPSLRSIKLPTPRSPWPRNSHNHRLR